MNLLYAASGDMRSAILSVANLPRSYRGPLEIVLNDTKLDFVARNVVILLVFFLEEDPIKTAEHVIHIWYSMLLTESCHSLLLYKAKRMVLEVCEEIEGKHGLAPFAKTFSFGESSLHVELSRNNWFLLLSYFNVPQGLTGDDAQILRLIATLEEGSVESNDISMYIRSPPARLAAAKFRADGMLLPFGHPRGEFKIPNPICDIEYIGIDATLKTFGPLLQPAAVNQYATLVTSFETAVHWAGVAMYMSMPETIRDEYTQEKLDQVLEYAPRLSRLDHTYTASITGLMTFCDMDATFNSYMSQHDFDSSALDAGLQMKATNTIIEPWPLRFSGGTPTTEAREEFAHLLLSSHKGDVRYVEWKLKREDVGDMD
ncbi:hypothetical protein Hte_011020 [Hypoxylon texense]